MTRREARAGAEPPAAPSPKSGSRLGSRRGSWAVALRMARRDVRRHKGRSAVILLMVGVPAMLLVFGLTLYATSTITGAERIPYEMGSGQALLESPSSNVVIQTPDPSSGTGGNDKAATPIPGYDGQGSYAAKSAALGRFLGGTVVTVDQVQVRVVLGDRSPRKEVLVADGRVGLGDKLRLTSGRWPVNDSEVLVTDVGHKGGLATTGTLVIDPAGVKHTVAVVGTATAHGRYGPAGDLVALTSFDSQGFSQPAFVLKRDTPVTWAEVLRLNQYGLVVISADVLRHPPSANQVPAQVAAVTYGDSRSQQTLAVAGGAILLLVTTLLVGPAFAVSASRQRRTLALAASNGAETGQLRHTVLAQALVLGVLAAGLGAVLGVLAVPMVTQAVLPRWFGYNGGGPFELPWLQVLGITAIAMLSSVIAALVPAQRLGRLDIVGVMRGQNVSPRLSRVLPVIGLVLAVAGGAILFLAIISGGRELQIVGGAVALILGTLFLVPLALVTVARLASHLPVPLRMATRDAARQRARSAPSVAAIVGAIAALTMMLIGLSSDTTQRQREYQPEMLAGESVVHGDYLPSSGAPDPVSLRSATDVIKREAPGLVAAPLDTVPGFNGPSGTDEPIPFANVVPTGCTPEQTVTGTEPDPNGAPFSKCQRYGSTAMTNHGGLGALPLDELARRLGLDDATTTKVRAGAVLMLGKDLPPTATFATGTYHVKPDSGEIGQPVVTGTTSAPVVLLPPTAHNLLAFTNSMGVLATPDTATRLGWPTSPSALLVHDPDGAIDKATEARLDAALGNDTGFRVERGFVREDALVMGIIVGIFAFLLLVITLTSTALSMAEQQTDQATLAAVGATRGTRRAMAAAQSIVVCGIGAVLGVVVGAVPGIAITYPLTTDQSSCDSFTGYCTDAVTKAAPIIDIPWTWLGLAVVGVPLVAAAVSALAVRRAPTMTRRAT